MNKLKLGNALLVICGTSLAASMPVGMEYAQDWGETYYSNPRAANIYSLRRMNNPLQVAVGSLTYRSGRMDNAWSSRPFQHDYPDPTIAKLNLEEALEWYQLTDDAIEDSFEVIPTLNAIITNLPDGMELESYENMPVTEDTFSDERTEISLIRDSMDELKEQHHESIIAEEGLLKDPGVPAYLLLGIGFFAGMFGITYRNVGKEELRKKEEES